MERELENRIRGVLDAAPIEFAYLFGSEAANRAERSSDIDLAVFADPALSAAARFDLRLKLIAQLIPVAAPKQIDLVVLNDAAPALAFSVLSTGRLLVCRAPLRRFDFEWKALARYHDRRYYDQRYTRLTLARPSVPK